MAGREASRNECRAAGAATLPIVRRVRSDRRVAFLAALAVARSRPWRPGTPCTGRSRFPASRSPRSSSTRTIQVVVGEQDATTSSPAKRCGWTRPRRRLRSCEAGHDSFLRRVRQLVDPSPPVLAVDPSSCRGPARRRSPSGSRRRFRGPAAPRSSPAAARSRSSRRGPATPSTPRSWSPRSRRRRSPACGRSRPRLTHVEPTLTTPAAEAAVAEAQALVDAAGGADVQGRGRRLADAAAAREARPLPGRRRELPGRVRPAAGGESRRADARAMAAAGGQRALRRRRQASPDPALAARPRRRRQVGGRLGRRSRRRHRSAAPHCA